jgi:hypothetical protein
MPTAPTVVTGNRTTLAGIQQARRVVEMANVIYGYDAGATPTLTVLQGRAATERAGNPKFQHLEDQPLPNWTTITNNPLTAVGTTINVAAGTGVYFRAGDLFVLPSAGGFTGPGELGKVSSVATDALTVIRNFNGDQVNGGAVNQNGNIQIVGNTSQEMVDTRTIKTTTEAVVSNFCGIIRTPAGVSGTLEASDTYGGNDMNYQRIKAAKQHALELERMFVFGRPGEVSATTERSTGGLLFWITSNVVNAGGTLTAATMESFCEKIFRYSTATKLFLVSRRILSQLDLIAEGRIETVPLTDTYGVAMKRYVTGHGDLMVVPHDMLINDFAGTGIAVDLSKIKVRYMQGSKGARNALLRMNIQAPGVDGEIDEYLSEIGLHVMLESAHGVLNGVA